MAKWTTLSNAIREVIYSNGSREITGQVLQNALLNIISNLGNFASFAGVATPSTNPGVPDGPVYYFATQAGTYTNFGALALDGSCYVLYWNGTAWSSTKFDLPTTAEVTSAMNALIATESTARQQADASLQSAIAAEATRASMAETEIGDKVSDFEKTEEGGIYQADNNGNVAFRVVNGIVDALGIGSSLEAVINELITAGTTGISLSVSELETAIGTITSDVNALGDKVSCIAITEEDGFFLIDEDNNIGLQLSDTGVFDAVTLGESIKAVIQELIPASSSSSSKESIDNYATLMRLRDETNDAINSLVSIKNPSGNNYTGTITVPAHTEARKNVVIRVGVHYGSAPNASANVWNDVFFGGNVNKDFSDVRFKDGDHILDTRLKHAGNYEVIRNNSIQIGSHAVADNGKLYRVAGSKLKSSTDTFTFTDEATLPHSNGMMVLGFDQQHNIYINYPNSNGDGGILYRGEYSNGGYASFTEVLDYRTANGTTDTDYTGLSIAPTAFAVDSVGYVYVGRYQLRYNCVIYRSVQPYGVGGFSIVYSETLNFKPDGSTPVDPTVQSQHVHHIDIWQTQDSLGNTVDNIIAGLDNGADDYGAHLIQSIDHGVTWTQMTCTDPLWDKQRGRDYSFTYLTAQKDATIVMGETNLLGGYTALKGNVETDANGKMSVVSLEPRIPCDYSCRMAKRFADGTVILPLLANGAMHLEYQIVRTDDNLTEFKPMYSEWCNSNTFSAGTGARWIRQFNDGQETFFVGTGFGTGSPNNRALNIYSGGNHYYGEFYVNVGDIPANETKTITVESGYLMQSPNRQIYKATIAPVWELNCNNGEYAEDNRGRRYAVPSGTKWDQERKPKFGGLYPPEQNYREGNGMQLPLGEVLNIGKIPSLTFGKNFTIVIWLRFDYDVQRSTQRADYHTFMPLLSIGNDYHLLLFEGRMFFGKFKEGDYYPDYAGRLSRIQLSDTFYSPTVLQSYVPIMLSVSGDAIPIVKATAGDALEVSGQAFSQYELADISLYDIKIGASNKVVTNYYSWNNWKIFINKISIFDRVLSRDEFRSVWHGCDVNIY